MSWPCKRCRRLNVASSTGTRAVNEPSGCPADGQIPSTGYCAKWTYRISAWLVARPCPRLSSDARSSPRNDIPTGYGIPFDRAAFVLCSTRDLITDEQDEQGRPRGKVRSLCLQALTVWVILVHPNSAFFVTRDDGQLLVRKEKVGGGYAALVRILRQNDEFVRILLYVS